jgi:hypothetical protein
MCICLSYVYCTFCSATLNPSFSFLLQEIVVTVRRWCNVHFKIPQNVTDTMNVATVEYVVDLKDDHQISPQSDDKLIYCRGLLKFSLISSHYINRFRCCYHIV